MKPDLLDMLETNDDTRSAPPNVLKNVLQNFDTRES